MNQKKIKETKNFGPVTSAELESMGIIYLDQIEKMGTEDFCRLYVQYFPERLNANAFLGVICALDNTVWTKAKVQHRVMAHNLVKKLKIEFNRS